MTGFSRVEGNDETASWIWEMRSVNGKSLDLRFRMPPGHEFIEAQLREIAVQYLKRGNIQISLNVEREGAAQVPVLNEVAFDAATALVRKASERSGLPMPGIDSILAVKGVVDLSNVDDDPDEVAARNRQIIVSFTEAVKLLAEARRSEGAAMGKVLLEQIGRIEALKEKVKTDPSREAATMRERLAEQLARLVDQSGAIDPQRLHQEAAILATRADLQEEIDRLESHIKAARELLASGGVIGRKLDFLSQEFNRECNTICSKSNAPSVTAAGLEMKVVIDQFREQVQNIQ